MATPSIQSTDGGASGPCFTPKLSYNPKASDTMAATVSRIKILSLYCSHIRRKMLLAFFMGKLLSLKIRLRSPKLPGLLPTGVEAVLSLLPDIAAVGSASETWPARVASSMLSPAPRSVRSPFSKPRRPPTALKAARDLGFRNLFSWPGVKAKGLFSAIKSFSVPGSGRKASSSSPATNAKGLLELLSLSPFTGLSNETRS